MTILFILLYASLFCYWVYRSDWFSLEAWSPLLVASMAALKMAVGLAYIYIHQYYVQGGDIFAYFKDGLYIYSHLSQDPLRYIELVLRNGGANWPAHLDADVEQMGFWRNPGTYLMVRLNAVFCLFSFGNMAVHGLFSGMISFIGTFFMAKFCSKDGRLLAPLVLFPGLLFWSSGLHKEFVLVAALGICVWAFSRLREGEWKWLLPGLLSGLLVFLIRDFMCYILACSLIPFLFLRDGSRKGWMVLIGMYGLAFIASVFVPLPGYGMDLLELIRFKQADFNSLQGSTFFHIPSFDGGFGKLLSLMGIGLYNTFIRPLPGQMDSIGTVLVGLENLLLIYLMVRAALRFKLEALRNPRWLLLATYGICLMIIIGMIVPNVGAIARYRTVALLFLLPAILMTGSARLNMAIKAS